MRQLNNGSNVIWEPLPGSQTLAAACPADIIFYHGSRGAGKTDLQLQRFRRNVGLGYGHFWRGIIYDREYKNLDDLISKSIRWFYQLGDGANFLRSKADYRWVWPSGESLYFRSIKRPEDYWNYHGHEYPFIGVNEMCKYPTDEIYTSMLSCNRSSFLPEENPVYINNKLWTHNKLWQLVDKNHPDAIKVYLPEIPLTIFITTNSYGPGHGWCKKEFIDPVNDKQMLERKIKVFDPRTKEDVVVTRSQVAIYGSWRDNKYLSASYIATLDSISDPNKRKSWLEGSWDINHGGMFSDEWDSTVHKIKPFVIPHTWKIDRAFDYGSSRPFSVGWFAESDGSDYVNGDGVTCHSVKGDVFRIAEWYGCTGKANEGLRLLSSDIAHGIVSRELRMGLRGRISAGVADSSIFDLIDGKSIASELSKSVTINGKVYPGVIWLKANKAPGSRKLGWETIRKYLRNAKPIVNDNGELQPRDRPGLFIFDCCRDTLAKFPNVPRDESDLDDVDTYCEDHIADEIRYRIMSSANIPKGVNVRGVLA